MPSKVARAHTRDLATAVLPKWVQVQVAAVAVAAAVGLELVLELGWAMELVTRAPMAAHAH